MIPDGAAIIGGSRPDDADAPASSEQVVELMRELAGAVQAFLADWARASRARTRNWTRTSQKPFTSCMHPTVGDGASSLPDGHDYFMLRARIYNH